MHTRVLKSLCAKMRANQSRPIRPSIEPLEQRTLLSVTLISNLAKGTQWTYASTGPSTNTETDTVGSAVTFNGNAATAVAVQTIVTAPVASTTNATVYDAVTTQGLVSYGLTAGTLTNNSYQTTMTNAPAAVLIPRTLTAGTSADSSYTSTVTQNPGSTTISHIGHSYLLQSEQTQSITVPAGTFDAYYITDAETSNGNNIPVQIWFVPNVGEVESIIGTGANQITKVLTAFKNGSGGGGGGGGTGVVTPSLITALPASIVATTPIKFKGKVVFTAGSAAVSGKASATILLSTDSNAANSVFTLGSASAALKLKAGGIKAAPIKFAKSIPANITGGVYHVLIQQTDTAGTTSTTDTGETIDAVAPAVDLTGSFVKFPAAAKAGKKSSVSFLITNASTANISATGTLPIDIETSSDGNLSDASVLTTINKHVNLKPGKSMKVSASVTLSSSEFVAVNLDPGSTVFSDDMNAANNYFATSEAVSVS